MEDLNPRWLAYMRSCGATDPAAFMEAERERWPGGCMVGFILWIDEQKREFARLYPQYMFERSSLSAIVNHDAWHSFICGDTA